MAEKRKNVAAGLGTAIALGAAAVAGAYYLYGKEGGKHRKQVRGWMLKARGEVIDKLETLGEWNQNTYHKVIDQVASKYKGLKNVDKDELGALVLDLKRHWKNIRRQLETSTKTTRHRKRPARRATKKTDVN